MSRRMLTLRILIRLLRIFALMRTVWLLTHIAGDAESCATSALSQMVTAVWPRRSTTADGARVHRKPGLLTPSLDSRKAGLFSGQAAEWSTSALFPAAAKVSGFLST